LNSNGKLHAGPNLQRQALRCKDGQVDGLVHARIRSLSCC
jgi:hypothetical protein